MDIKSIYIYDFENLFTNIPVKDLKEILFDDFDLCMGDLDFNEENFSSVL